MNNKFHCFEISHWLLQNKSKMKPRQSLNGLMLWDVGFTYFTLGVRLTSWVLKWLVVREDKLQRP